jgi:hypothetical protein
MTAGAGSAGGGLQLPSCSRRGLALGALLAGVLGHGWGWL